jgi:hypothetical protein
MERVNRIMKTVGRKAKALPESVLIGEPERRNTPEADPDLARVLAAWPQLPTNYKQTILTLIEVAERGGSET